LSFWRYALRRILCAAGIFLLLMFFYSALLEGELELIDKSNLSRQSYQMAGLIAVDSDLSTEEQTVLRQEIYQSLLDAANLDGPLLSRTARRMVGVFVSGFGISKLSTVSVERRTGTQSDRSVICIIGEAMIPTLLLFTGAFLFYTLLAFLLGVRNTSRPGSRLDRATMRLAIVTSSVPPFVAAMFAVLIFVFLLRLAPSDPWVNRFPAGLSELGPWFRDFLRHYTLPFFSLIVVNVFIQAIHVRNLMVESLTCSHIRAARARGIRERNVLFGHGLRTAAPPLLTLVSQGLFASLWGSFLVEPIFQWPGIGQLFLKSILERDAQMAYALLIILTGIYNLGLIVLDLVYGKLDPRIKVGTKATL